MAEVVGVVASILTLASAGAKLSIILFEFSSSLGSAGSEIQQIAIEISLFCSVLKQLESTLTKAKGCRYSLSALATTGEILSRCSEIFTEIETILASFKGKKKDGDVDWKARVKWTFKKGEVKLLRATLESCKITLHLMLTTMEFAQKVAKRRTSTLETEKEDEDERTITQSLLIARQSTVNTLERLEEEQSRQSAVVDAQLSPSADRRPDRLAPAHGQRTQVWHRQSRSFDGGQLRFADLGQDIIKRKRASAWLNNLVFDTSPLPAGFRRQTWGETQCTTFLGQQHYQLLHKWTTLDEEQPGITKVHGISRFSPDQAIDEEFSNEVEQQPSISYPERQASSSSKHLESWMQEAVTLESDFKVSKSKIEVIDSPNLSGLPDRLPSTSSKFINNSKWGSIYERRDIDLPKLELPDPFKIVQKPQSTPQVEIHKSFRVSLHDSTRKLLPAALKKYNINAPVNRYSLYITYGENEWLCGPDDLPLVLFKDLDTKGLKPTFMLRKRPVYDVPEPESKKQEDTVAVKESNQAESKLMSLDDTEGSSYERGGGEVDAEPKETDPKTWESAGEEGDDEGGNSGEPSSPLTYYDAPVNSGNNLKRQKPRTGPKARKGVIKGGNAVTKTSDSITGTVTEGQQLKDMYGVDDLSQFFVSHGRSRKEFATYTRRSEMIL